VKLLNIGCGTTYHPAWTNIDLEPASRDVMRHHAGRPLPFGAGSFDACYCSHMLEHLSQDEARQLLSDVHRVLKPGAVLRIVVPDLEGIVRAYLKALDQALSSPKGYEQARYDWIMLELVDQLVRAESGGRMAEFLKRCPLPLRELVTSRIGCEAEQFWANEQQGRGLARFYGKSPAWFADKGRFLLVCCFARLIGGKRGLMAVKEGWFRTSGEVHRWMYDRFSLGRLLEQAEFKDVVVCDAERSRIANFASYRLDAIYAVVRKPDSLFMEGVRP